MTTDEQTNPALGYGLLGFGLGLTLFTLFYLTTVRMRVAEPTTGLWLAILLAVLLVPAFTGAMMGLNRHRRRRAQFP